MKYTPGQKRSVSITMLPSPVTDAASVRDRISRPRTSRTLIRLTLPTGTRYGTVAISPRTTGFGWLLYRATGATGSGADTDSGEII